MSQVAPLFQIGVFILSFLNQLILALCIAWFLPMQANTFFKENVSPKVIIATFILQPAFHLLCLPFTSILHYKFHARLPIFLGLLLLPLSLLCIGRVTLTGAMSNQSPQVSGLGLAILGIAGGLMSPSLTDEAKSAVQFTANCSQINNQITLDYFIHTFLASIHHFGLFCGLLLSAELQERFGKEVAYQIVATIVMLYALVYFLSSGHFKMFKMVRNSVA